MTATTEKIFFFYQLNSAFIHLCYIFSMFVVLILYCLSTVCKTEFFFDATKMSLNKILDEKNIHSHLNGHVCRVWSQHGMSY